MPWTREQMAARAAQEMNDGFYANLGIGIPTLVANYIPKNVDVTLQSGNGMLGLGPFPTASQIDADIINAGKQTIGWRQLFLPTGSSNCRRSDNYGIGSDQLCVFRGQLRHDSGGTYHLSVLGAMEVSETGDLANWMVPEKMVKGPAARWTSLRA